jgi:nucleotide-binding universal stress UspA family protein
MTYKRILIAVDGSAGSRKAAKAGLLLAKQLKAFAVIVCITDLTNAIDSANESSSIDKKVEKAYSDEANKIIARITKNERYKKLSTLIAGGVPQYEITKIAKKQKADLIVMGTHGRTGLRHLLMGSIAEYVIRHSTIPVFVVPEAKKK